LRMTAALPGTIGANGASSTRTLGVFDVAYTPRGNCNVVSEY